jgi:hypothetical protein
MNSAIKIIKRSTSGKSNNIPAPSVGKTEQERERNTASTVKGWVAEWEQRKRSLQIAAFVFVAR